MNTRWLTVLIALLGSLLISPAALAQDASLTLELSRNWGYGGFNNDIQGMYSLKASGPADLTRVEFYIDAAKIGEAAQAPFTLEFVTDDHPNGEHSLYAKGTTAGGKQLTSQRLAARFIPAAEGTKNMLGFVVPILVIVFGAIALAAIVPLVAGRKARSLAPGTLRQYPLGGGICPKCGRPVAFHLFGLNMPGGKIERCPSCGKWSLIRFATIDKLRTAEMAEVAGGQAKVPVMSDEQKLKKELDESKYQDV
jgi:hypothetical protein